MRYDAGGRQPGTYAPGGISQFANFDKDPMEQRAVGFGAGRGAGSAGHAPVPGQLVRFTDFGQDPMERRGGIGGGMG